MCHSNLFLSLLPHVLPSISWSPVYSQVLCDQFFLPPQMSENVWHVSFSPWFPWFNIVSSCSIQVASTDWISSFHEQIIFHCVYMPVFKIHLLTNDSIYGILSIVLQSTWEFIYPSPKLISFPYIQASRQFSWSHGSSIASGFFFDPPSSFA
jgi:hypothetical protein